MEVNRLATPDSVVRLSLDDDESEGLSGLSDAEVEDLLPINAFELRAYLRGFRAALRAMLGLARELLESLPRDE